MSEHYQVIKPQSVGYGLSDGHVLITLNYDSAEFPWLAPDIRLALVLTPEEARSMGHALIRKADAAESA